VIKNETEVMRPLQRPLANVDFSGHIKLIIYRKETGDVLDG